MDFRMWLEETISDYLSKIDVKANKNFIRSFLQQHLRSRDLDVATNLFTYIYYQEKSDPRRIAQDWQEFGDYLSDNLQKNRNQFLNHTTRKTLENGNLAYHRDLSISASLRKGPEGYPIVNVSERLKSLANEITVPRNFDAGVWEGWNWVSLGHGYSKEEGSAGGHCGNVACKTGDNIISLRNPSGHVLLTFIVNVNTGELGEAKGLNNKKPTKEYHPAIVALLVSPYVRKYKGGGYEVEDEGIFNFSPEDLRYLPEIYNYVIGHLENKQDHKIPENYYPLSWLNQWTESKVNQMRTQDKVRFLHDIVKVFDNHSPMESGGTGANDKWEYFEKVPQVQLNFDLNKLVYEVIPQIKKIKQGTEILKGLSRIVQDNQVTSEKDVQLFRPDVDPATVDKKKLDWRHSEDRLKKYESVNVDYTTLHGFIKHVLDLQKNIRDKVDLVHLLSDIGYREDYLGAGEPDHADYKNWKEYNIYQDKIDKISREIVEECIAKKEIPEYCTDTILQAAQEVNKSNMSFLDITRDRKKIAARVDMYQFGVTVGVDKKVEEVFPEIRQEYIKNGYSRFLGGLSVRHFASQARQSRLAVAVRGVFSKVVQKAFEKQLRQQFKGKAKISEHDITYFTDAINFLKKYLKGESSQEINEFYASVKRIYETVSLKNLKELKKIMLDNMQEIIKGVKEHKDR
jgi:hypothetical protein